MNDRLDAYRQRFAAPYRAENAVDGDPYKRIVAVVERFPREHPLDTLTDRLWSAMIRVACFVGKFILAAAIGIILGRFIA